MPGLWGTKELLRVGPHQEGCPPGTSLPLGPRVMAGLGVEIYWDGRVGSDIVTHDPRDPCVPQKYHSSGSVRSRCRPQRHSKPSAVVSPDPTVCTHSATQGSHVQSKGFNLLEPVFRLETSLEQWFLHLWVMTFPGGRVTSEILYIRYSHYDS